MIGGLNGEKISDYHIDSDKPMPGIYDMDVYLNNQWRGHYNVDIKDDPDATCLSLEQLKQIGILTEGINIDKRRRMCTTSGCCTGRQRRL